MLPENAEGDVTARAMIEDQNAWEGDGGLWNVPEKSQRLHHR